MVKRKNSTVEEDSCYDACKTICAAPQIKASELKKFQPLTENQKAFFDLYDIGGYFTTLHGSAGTGKTFISLYKAIEDIFTRGTPYKRVVIIRSAVQGRDIGHLPGTKEDKVDVYSQPYRDICSILFNRSDAWERLVQQKRIELVTTSFIRGVSFDDAVIIVDEAQNCNFSELNTIITRVGHQSKIIFCGDYRQTDLYRNKNDVSGIKRFLEVADTMACHSRIEFTADDICRSSLVKDWIIAEAAFSDKEFAEECRILKN
jgi:predicted ribonuclease YlaK